MNEEKKMDKGKMGLYLVIALLVVFIILMSIGMVSITVLDPQPLQNITLQINIT